MRKSYRFYNPSSFGTKRLQTENIFVHFFSFFCYLVNVICVRSFILDELECWIENEERKKVSNGVKSIERNKMIAFRIWYGYKYRMKHCCADEKYLLLYTIRWISFRHCVASSSLSRAHCAFICTQNQCIRWKFNFHIDKYFTGFRHFHTISCIALYFCRRKRNINGKYLCVGMKYPKAICLRVCENRRFSFFNGLASAYVCLCVSVQWTKDQEISFRFEFNKVNLLHSLTSTRSRLRSEI